MLEQESDMDFGDWGAVFGFSVIWVYQQRGKLVKINGVIYVRVY